MTKKESQISETFYRLNETTIARIELEKQARDLKKLEDQYKAQLAASIEPEQTIAGVLHHVTTKPSISYAKLYSRILSDYVPKTKASEVEALKETEYTSFSTQHTFKLTGGLS